MLKILLYATSSFGRAAALTVSIFLGFVSIGFAGDKVQADANFQIGGVSVQTVGIGQTEKEALADAKTQCVMRFDLASGCDRPTNVSYSRIPEKQKPDPRVKK